MLVRYSRAVGRRARRVARRVLGRPAPPALDRVTSVVFDASFYREIYEDVGAANADPVAHFISHGREERRSPSVLFDSGWYLERNQDVAASGVDPLQHFLTSGGLEGRDPVPAGFSSAWYLEQHPDVARKGINPLVHFLTEGVAQGYDPCPHFDVKWYLKQNSDIATAGINPLVHYLRYGIAEGRRPNDRGTNLTGGSGTDTAKACSVQALLTRRHPDLTMLRSIPGRNVPRINIITDSVGPDSLFGGVATAILLGSFWANRTGRRLRIVTRHCAPDGAGLAELFRTVGFRPDRQPDLAFVPTGPGDFLEVGDDDVFLTTSWWSTTAVLRAVPADRVVYLLQEDERSFYPTGARTLGATAAMNHPDLAVVVNTRRLLDHLVSTGIDNLSTTGVAFEPSFAAFLRPGRVIGGAKPRHLFFYARPNNPRNLFDVGVAALDAAIEAGAFPRERWRIHFVGRGAPQVDFCDGSRPVLHDALGWAQYHELLGRVGLGLSLMASPHPSYPPFDLAAGGSVVVTNRWPGKMDFADVSDRVVVAEPTVPDLARALQEAAAMVEELSDQPFEPAATPYFTPWVENLDHVVEHLVTRYGDV